MVSNDSSAVASCSTRTAKTEHLTMTELLEEEKWLGQERRKSLVRKTISTPKILYFFFLKPEPCLHVGNSETSYRHSQREDYHLVKIHGRLQSSCLH